MGRGIACAATALLLAFAGSASAAGRAYPFQTGNVCEFYRADGTRVDTGGHTWYGARWLGVDGDGDAGGEAFGYAVMEAVGGEAPSEKGRKKIYAPSMQRYMLPDGTVTEGVYRNLYRSGPAIVAMLPDGAGCALLDPATGARVVDGRAYFEQLGDTGRYLTRKAHGDRKAQIVDARGAVIAEVEGDTGTGYGASGRFTLTRDGADGKAEPETALYDSMGKPCTAFYPYLAYFPDADIALGGEKGDVRAIDVSMAQATGSGYGVPLTLGGHTDVESAFPGGLFIVRDGDESGVVDRDGDEIIAMGPGWLSDVRASYGSDMAFVRETDGRRAVYATDGTQLTPAMRDVDALWHGRDFASGTVIRCYDGDAYRYITAKGAEIDLHGAWASEEIAPGLFLVRDEAVERSTGAMDAEGNWVLPPIYSYIQGRFDLPQPYLVASNGMYERYFTTQGAPYAGMRYIARVAEDVYQVRQGLRYGLADARGTWIVERSQFDRFVD